MPWVVSWEETLEIEEVEGPEIQLIDTIEIRLGEIGQMDLLNTPNANYIYTWSPTTALSCVDCPEPEIVGLTN